MKLRSAVFALAVVLAGALAFIFAAVGTVVLLADRDPGASDGATPATASDQVASRQRTTARDEGSDRGSSPVKARAYFLDEIRRH